MKCFLFATLCCISFQLGLPSTVVITKTVTTTTTNLNGSALINHINSNQSLWQAATPNRSRLHTLMAVEHADVPDDAQTADVQPVAVEIPDSFDSRTQWPNCKTIQYIRDQSDCGCCWAFAAAEAMSDRFCIASNGAMKPVLSTEDLVACCPSATCGNGCNGGYSYRAWQYMQSTGVVTGGGFYEQVGCMPFTIAPCGGTYKLPNGTSIHPGNCPTTKPATPQCPATTSCPNSKYTSTLTQDKYFGKSAYQVPNNVTAIQQEIMTNGPVEASFTVYTDFDNYKSGIYKYTTGTAEGGHSIKIIGWGTEDGTDYWLCSNSWTTSWGENGFFRIVRGTNECGIEAAVVAGLPDVSADVSSEESSDTSSDSD